MADDFTPYDVSIPYPALAERFEEWVRSQGWGLSDIVNIEGSDRPMRFVQPSFGTPPVPKQAPVEKPHRANGPYLPVGDLGGEYCVRCRKPWPCPDAPVPKSKQCDHEDMSCPPGECDDLYDREDMGR